MEHWILNDLLKGFDTSHYFDKTKVPRQYLDKIKDRLTRGHALSVYIEDINLVQYQNALKRKGINLIMNEYPDGKYVSLRKLYHNCYITSDIEFANIFELENCPALMKIVNHYCDDEWVESDKYNQIMVRYYKLTPDGKIEIKQKIYRKVENIKKGFGYLVDSLYLEPYNIDYCAGCHPFDMNIFIPYNSKGFAGQYVLGYYYNSTTDSEHQKTCADYITAMCGINSMSDLSVHDTYYHIKDWYCYREFDTDLLKQNTYTD